MAQINTSFGTMETLLERDGAIVSELLTFLREGRTHKHPVYETCYVLAGRGTIVSGENRIEVRKGSVCTIPPNTDHWMIPKGNEALEILLVYSDSI